MAQKVYSFQEVAKHNKRDDCWLIMFGKVLNVTPFIEDHPGGPEILLMATGKDATVEFEAEPHTPSAYEKMKGFIIGDIDPSTYPELLRNPQVARPNNSGYFSSNILLNFLPLLIIGVAILLFFSLKGVAKQEYCAFMDSVHFVQNN